MSSSLVWELCRWKKFKFCARAFQKCLSSASAPENVINGNSRNLFREKCFRFGQSPSPPPLSFFVKESFLSSEPILICQSTEADASIRKRDQESELITGRRMADESSNHSFVIKTANSEVHLIKETIRRRVIWSRHEWKYRRAIYQRVLKVV